jgi:hypothetical protein
VVKLTDITGSPDSLAVEADADVVLYKYVESQTDIMGEVTIICIVSTSEIDFRRHEEFPHLNLLSGIQGQFLTKSSFGSQEIRISLRLGFFHFIPV